MSFRPIRGAGKWAMWAAAIFVFTGISAAATPERLGPAVRRLILRADLTRPVAAEFGATVGWSFETKARLRVTHLGFFDSSRDGLFNSHRVGLWDSRGRLVASTVVEEGDAGTLWRQYRYNAVRPVILPAGHTFTVGATVPARTVLPFGEGSLLEIDFYPYLNVRSESLRMDKRIDLLDGGLIGGQTGSLWGVEPPGTLAYPSVQVEGGSMFAANLLVEDVLRVGKRDLSSRAHAEFLAASSASTPEPSASGMLIGAVLLLVRRWRVSAGARNAHTASANRWII